MNLLKNSEVSRVLVMSWAAEPCLTYWKAWLGSCIFDEVSRDVASLVLHRCNTFLHNSFYNNITVLFCITIDNKVYLESIKQKALPIEISLMNLLKKSEVSRVCVMSWAAEPCLTYWKAWFCGFIFDKVSRDVASLVLHNSFYNNRTVLFCSV